MQTQVIGSNSMSVSEMIKQAIATKGLQQKDIAVKMGWSPQGFTNRLSNNTIDAEEWVKTRGNNRLRDTDGRYRKQHRIKAA